MPCTSGKLIAGVVAPLGMRFAFAEKAVKVSVVKDIPLLGLVTSFGFDDFGLTVPAPPQRRLKTGSQSD